jgi:RHS repeat-associated protein
MIQPGKYAVTFRYHPSNGGNAPGYGSFPYGLRITIGDATNTVGGNYAPWDAWYGLKDYRVCLTVPTVANQIRFEVLNGIPNALLDDVTLERLPDDVKEYLWGLDLSGSLQGAGGIGGLLAEITPEETRFPFCDANGNITDWVDDSGTLLAHHEYDPYGNELSDNPPSSFGFSSKPIDPNIGIYYYGYRFYSPQWGRWINRDPIGENGLELVQGINDQLNEILGVSILIMGAEEENLYAITQNNPINLFDVLGLRDCTPAQPPKEWTRRPNAPPVTVDGCSNPVPGVNPNNPSGHADFTDACNAHDSCYSDCDRTFEECNAALGNDLRHACNNQNPPLTGKALTSCLKWANRYAWAVDGRTGRRHYNNAQNEQCDCLCP